jgi:hypothetical protein
MRHDHRDAHVREYREQGTAAKLLDGGALSPRGTHASARGPAAAPTFLP